MTGCARRAWSRDGTTASPSATRRATWPPSVPSSTQPIVERADLLVTFSTPTLQVALGRARGVPVVFTYVASPVAAGAGSNDRDHPPTITGVYMEPAYEPMLDVIRRLKPNLQSIGTLFVPSESNSVYMHARLRAGLPQGRASASRACPRIRAARSVMRASRLRRGNRTRSARSRATSPPPPSPPSCTPPTPRACRSSRSRAARAVPVRSSRSRAITTKRDVSRACSRRRSSAARAPRHSRTSRSRPTA